MINWVIILPVILPFASAAAVLLYRGDSVRQQQLSIAASLFHLAACIMLLIKVAGAGIISSQIGGWPAPFGITLAADHFSALMVAIAGVLGLAVNAYSREESRENSMGAGFHPLMHILMGGVCGAFLTGDVFNLYVWFEVMLMASFGLLVLGQEKSQFDGGVKYVMINLFATLLFITGIGLLYGMTGTLNMADLHLAVQDVENRGLLGAVAAVFMTAFGIKAGIFPLFFWLPVSYHTPPVAVSTILAGLMTKVGVYAMIRMFTLVFIFDTAFTHGLLLAAGVVTMVVGVLGTAAFYEFRRILSFHIISQVGYMITGLAIFTPLALAGAVFFLLHNMIVKANLFLISGAVKKASGSFELSGLGGLYKNHWFLALLFFISAFSLAGFPPFSGFWAKMIVIRAGLESRAYVAAAAAIIVGLLTTYSMTKIWAEAFWKPSADDDQGDSDRQGSPERRPGFWMIAPIAVLVVITLVIGLMPAPFVAVAEQAAHELLNPEIYVKTVLGEP
ncbi:MAG: Na+/H+ antiporter subunit D [Desulfobacterales bacterium]